MAKTKGKKLKLMTKREQAELEKAVKRARVSKSQKAAWRRRKEQTRIANEVNAKVWADEAQIKEPPINYEPLLTKEQEEKVTGCTFDSIREADCERDITEIRDWINSAATLEERQKRKAAMMGVMYGRGSRFPGTLAEKIQATWRAEGGDPKPFNPDSMFKYPPLHHDPVNSPAHYLQHPSGIEPIQISEHFNFNRGNAIHMIWRAGLKSQSSEMEDLRKARWYIDREIQRLEKEAIR